MNIAIIGRSELLFDTANLLLQNGHKIKVIITSKEAPEYKITSDDFKLFADKISAEYLYTAKINDKKSIKYIKGLDLGISVNYSSLINDEVIGCFRLGILNAHGGDLPRFKGNACQAWAIINGENKIGLCIHRMEGDSIDSGDILAREHFDIDINTKIGVIYRWMNNRIPELFLKVVKELEKNENYILEKKSSDVKNSLRCFPRLQTDGKIDWKNTNEDILRLINASSEPYSGAFCEYEKNKFIIWDAEIFEYESKFLSIPGQIIEVNRKLKYVVVACGKGMIRLNEIEYYNYRGEPSRIIGSIRKRLE